jgi:hypothetical protein
MAKKQSFLDRVQPNRARTKLIDWPFETAEPVKVRMRVLGADELEAAHFEAMDHFKDGKRKVLPTDQAFVIREQISLAWRAYETEDGEKIAADADELAAQPMEISTALYREWSRFQDEITVRPISQEQLDTWIDGLKKNTLADLLPALPSSWLIKLITTLASQHAASTTASEPG